MVVEENNFNYELLKNLDVIKNKRRKNNGRDYLNIVCAFDIECSSMLDIEQSFMYIFQFQFGDDITIVGRTWDEFKRFIEKVSSIIKEIGTMVVYVHNLSYEFQFLKGQFKFNEEDVFCLDSRKILKCIINDCIEFRCSYYLTNLSLNKLLLKYDVENKKLSGDEFDYSKMRYPWSPMTAKELEYCINDVKGLVQAIKKQMQNDGDDLSSIPLTSTGYVRRDVKRAMKTYNHLQLKDMLPDVEIYKLLRETFRGGDTLSNRFNTDEIIEDVKSVDIVSSYPSSMLMNEFPMTKFYQENVDDFEKLYKQKTKALLFRIVFYDLDVKNYAEGHLYLSRDKCRDIIKGTYVNGRILCADYLETTLTDIDFEIINRRYQYSKCIIKCLYSSRYKKLPLAFRNEIINYYKVKTTLKGCNEGTDDYLFYMKNKEKLNSTYGMSVEDIGKDRIIFKDGEYTIKDETLKDLIERNNKSAFLNYAWGIWVTAWSRKRLADGIDIVTKNGKEPMNFIYSDTDSIKYNGDVSFDKYNKKVEECAIDNKAYAIDNYGEVHYMGVFEDEGYQLPNRFKTLGAKKYVLEDTKGKMHITISGVDKRKGADELGCIENFKEGFIFKKGGGTESVFNDNVDINLDVDGHQLNIKDNILIKDSTYTLGITAEYRAILNGSVDIKYSDVDIEGLYKVKN